MRLRILTLLLFVRVAAGLQVVDYRWHFRPIYYISEYIYSLELVCASNNYMEHWTVQNSREDKLSIVGIRRKLTFMQCGGRAQIFQYAQIRQPRMRPAHFPNLQFLLPLGVLMLLKSNWLSVDTSSKLWEGALPQGIPPNSYLTVRMIAAGRSVCLTGETCTRFIQAESQEFITFNSNSTVTSLPNGGIRTTVPTPTPNSTKTIPTALHTITMSFTGWP